MAMNARGLKARLGELCSATEEMRDRAQERLDNAATTSQEEAASDRLEALELILQNLEEALEAAESL